ncbi:MAG: NAD(P)/FAD-dependent oxidoreductase [Salinibacterium amurskyense]
MSAGLVVVGGGIAAIRTVESARAAGYTGAITIVGDEVHLPYERPPLSKQVLTGEFDPRVLFPRSEDDLAGLSADIRLGVKATNLDRARQVVSLDDGSDLAYETLVIATGARARPLPFEVPPGVHVVRTLDDCRAIAQRLSSRPRVAIVGAGFVGLEVAATARAMGSEVTLIEAGRVPLVRALGPVMGANCAALHERNGVRVRTHGRVMGFTSAASVTGVILEDETVPAELVVVGIGAMPNHEWLQGSGLELGDGVLCSANGQADSSGTIFCVGDVAAWWSSEQNTHVRQEHWSSAVEQAKFVGAAIAGATTPPYDYQPYFWSDQYGMKIQMLGTAEPDDTLTVIAGSAAQGKFLAIYSHGQRVTALLSFGLIRELVRARPLFDRRAPLSDFLELRERFADAHPAVPAI